MEPPTILLTNDDGIESAGLRALYDALSSIADVTVVAPAENQSATGRSISYESVSVEERDLGYAIGGTPVDCVIAGLRSLAEPPDLVVAGCNQGANLGSYVLGRSGTVSAAVEAAFFGVPAMAVSLYVPPRDPDDFEEVVAVQDNYAEAARAARYLVERGFGTGLFEAADYLNLNAPLPTGEPKRMEVTRPATAYEMDATRNGDRVTLHDRVWERLGAGEVDAGEGTDRRAIVEGRVSVSPLTVPHITRDHESLDELAAAYPDG